MLKFQDAEGKVKNVSYRAVRSVNSDYSYLRCQKAIKYLRKNTHHKVNLPLSYINWKGKKKSTVF